MKRWQRLRALVRNTFRRAAVDRDLHEELASYVELAADEERAKGLSSLDANRRARVRFGGAAAVVDSVREARAGARVEQLWRDVRYALRGLGRARGYTVAAILTLGVGIGANTAIFAAVDAAIFKPLPYRDPDGLVEIAQMFNRDSGMATLTTGMGWKEFDRWRGERTLFSEIAPYANQQMQVDAGSTVRRGRVSLVGPGMIELLGIRMRLGRSFVADEARRDAPVAVLTEEFWRTAFRADPTVLGRTLTLNGRAFTVIGVAPADLRWGFGGVETVAFVPLDANASSGKSRGTIGAIARLGPGLTRASANERLRRRVDALQAPQAGVPAEKR